jgi:hypothetical protein
MKINHLLAVLCQIIVLPLLLVVIVGCANKKSDAGDIENLVRRYNVLLIQGYQKQDMNPMQEVTTEEHARRLYHHMSALGEGKLRMESKLKDIKFKNVDQRSSTEATVETEETWDFTHYRMGNNEKYAEEKDFIYRMGYILNKKDGRWMITQVNTISGTSTNTVIPLPQLDRKGNKVNSSQDGGKPANHP